MIELPFYVYAIFRPDGTPCYVGKGNGNRWRHNSRYGRNLHLLRIIANAKAIGTPVLRTKLIENLSEPDALMLEAFFIAAISRQVDGGPLVNFSIGGESGPVGYKWTEEQRRAHAPRKGTKQSDETRAAISAALKGKPKSEQHIANAANARRGLKVQTGWWTTEEGRAKQRANNRGHTGFRHSEETKQKIRQARATQTVVGGRFEKGYQPTAETRARLSAAVTASWARRRSDSAKQGEL